MAQNSTPYTGRSLPHDDGAEKSVLGAILLNAQAFEEVSDLLSPADFYHTPHQMLYAAIVDFKAEVHTASLDTIVLYNYLKEKNLLDKCGGIGYISSLTDDISAAAQVGLYANIVHKNAVRRNVITLCSQCEGSAIDLSNDVYQVIDDFEQKMNILGEQNGSQADVTLKGFVNSAFKQIRDKMTGKFVNDVYASGFDKLDSMMDGGFHPTDYIIIAARPSIGKTAFALSIIRNMISPPNRYKVAFFSLEMSGLQVSQRLLSSVSNVSLKKIRGAKFLPSDDRDFENIISASSKLSDCDLSIYDTPNMKLTEIRSAARKQKRENGVNAIIIDYIGLIDSGLDSTVPRYEQVAYVSRNLKALARELQIPVIVLCQVNREAEDNVKEPQLNNLRDSGAIEQDADLVMFLHRSRKTDKTKLQKDNSGNYTIQPTKVIVAKQRNGETGVFTVGFKTDSASFENTEVEYQDEADNSSKFKQNK